MVSDQGRVRSLPRITSSGRWRGGSILSGSVSKRDKRRRVKLCRNGSCDTRIVARLVAEAFVPNPECLRSVLHINGDILDDRACNLVWGDQPTNSAEGWSEERAVPVRSHDGRRYGSMTEAASEFGVAVSSVRQAADHVSTCRDRAISRESDGDPDASIAGTRKKSWGVDRVMDADGAELKRIMTKEHITVNELAAKSGVSATKIWRLRSGKENPRTEELEKIADALGVKPSDLRKRHAEGGRSE